jgi:hypothetical protein
VSRSPDRASYDHGAIVQLTANASAGWEFRSWCGDASGSTNPVAIAMTQDRSATAVFNEVGAPMVAIVSPNGGETLAIGGVAEIRWNASDAEGVDLVDVLLSRSGPAGPFETLGSVENTGSFTWAVSYPGTQNAYVKVVAHNPTDATPSLSGFDLSDAAFVIPDLVTGVENSPANEFSMRLASGNPASDGATIAFGLPQTASVRIEVFDIAGRLVDTVVEAQYPAGLHSARWSGRSRNGEASSGVYFIRLRTLGHTTTRRFVLMR